MIEIGIGDQFGETFYGALVVLVCHLLLTIRRTQVFRIINSIEMKLISIIPILLFSIDVSSQEIYNKKLAIGLTSTGNIAEDIENEVISITATFIPYFYFGLSENFCLGVSYSYTFGTNDYISTHGMQDIGILLRYSPILEVKDKWFYEKVRFFGQLNIAITNEEPLLENDYFISTKSDSFNNFFNRLDVGATINVWDSFLIVPYGVLKFYNYDYRGFGMGLSIEYVF